MTNESKLPEGRLSRFARLASLGARAGANLLFAKKAESTAHEMAEVLGTLRGIAAKVGQMASYVDGVVPEEQRATYEAALGKLRAAAPTSSPTEVRRVIEEELGAPIDELFVELDEHPIASASIGQVHRGRLHDGREVAVKVQHPGVAKAVESDLANGSVIEHMVRAMGGRKLDSKRLYEEVCERFREELDYALEAQRQRSFRALHASDPTIHIPEVIDHRSTGRVLTSDFVRGRTLEEVGAASEEARRAYAETLWRFVFKGNLVGGMFNADPHPGNYVFQDDGRISFLDFGCIQLIEGERKQDAITLHEAALRRDEAGFGRAAAAILKTRGGRYEEAAIAYSRHCFVPIFSSPFRITRDFSGGLFRAMKDLGMEARTMEEGDFVPLPPGMVFMNRLQCGFYSVLARLDAEVDYAAVERGFIEEARARWIPAG